MEVKVLIDIFIKKVEISKIEKKEKSQIYFNNPFHAFKVKTEIL